MIMLNLATSIIWSSFRRSVQLYEPACTYICLRGKYLFSSDTEIFHDSSSDSTDKPDVFEGPIPRDKLTISFSRSSGPGGQNVNKLNTKAEVRFHIESAKWIPERVKRRLTTLHKTRITKLGELIITSQKYRTQSQNTEDAIHKLEDMLKEASEVPKGPSDLTVARIQALKKKAHRQRRIDKKYHSLKKGFRRQIDID